MTTANRIPTEHQKEAGFTLIELLVAMTLLSLVMLVLFGGLRFGARVWERTETHMAGANDVARIQTLLRRELREAYPAYSVGSSNTGHVDFSGTEDSITFLGPAPRSLAEAGRAWIAVRVIHDKNGIALRLSAKPELGSGNESQDEDLLTDLKSAKFSYFGVTEGDKASWHETWDDAQRLPNLVRLQVAFSEKSKLVWPEFVAAPTITVDVNCAYDPLTRDCQGR